MAALAVTQLVRASSQSWMILYSHRGQQEQTTGISLSDLRLACLVAVISFTSLSWGHWGVINKLQKVLAKAGNDGKLLAVLFESIKLIGESRLELLASNVGKLGLCNERLCLSTDKLLFENNDAGAVRLLILKLSDLICDLLFAYIICSLAQSLNVE